MRASSQKLHLGTVTAASPLRKCHTANEVEELKQSLAAINTNMYMLSARIEQLVIQTKQMVGALQGIEASSRRTSVAVGHLAMQLSDTALARDAEALPVTSVRSFETEHAAARTSS